MILHYSSSQLAREQIDLRKQQPYCPRYHWLPDLDLLGSSCTRNKSSRTQQNGKCHAKKKRIPINPDTITDDVLLTNLSALSLASSRSRGRNWAHRVAAAASRYFIRIFDLTHDRNSAKRIKTQHPSQSWEISEHLTVCLHILCYSLK